uniref:Cyclin-T2-like n=1 Tax=Gouania willdenowi TaxID=441366 RepID=A0A8C5HEL2_GOUWI
MAATRGPSSKWFFTREQLESTPSRRCGVEPDRELSYRQQAANLIQDMGQRLNVSQLTINTAIVYMHRFYMNHSFTKFHRNIISPTTLFLAAKVEEQPRKLEHVIKVAHACLNPQESPLDTKSNAYLQQAQELVILESIVLQTLGFEITIDHPHTDVVKCSQLVRASKDLAQTSYFMATNSLHLTTFCLQYKPTVIACVCIHLACKWSNWEIPVSTDGKHWWEYVDRSVTLELLDELTHEFLQILEKTPSRLKRIRNWRATQAAKKPKSENSNMTDNSFSEPSMLQDQGDVSIPGISSSNPSFSKAAAAFPVPLPGTYNPSSSSEWPQGSQSQAAYSLVSMKQEPISIPLHDTEKMDLIPIKQEGKGKLNQQPQFSYPTSQPSTPQKLSLDKYREKHVAELSVSAQKRRHEQHGGDGDALSSSFTYAPTTTTASPMKIKVPSLSSSHDKRREKGTPKFHVAVPSSSSSSSQLDKSGLSKDELKMKIKLSSSERHSSSDESIAAANNNKSKHSSPLVSREKHHNRHHKHSHANSGNGRGGGFEGPAGSLGQLIRGHMDGSSSLLVSSGASSSTRKRVHADVGYNHHPSSSSSSCSKMNKVAKGGPGAAGTASSSPFPVFPPSLLTSTALLGCKDIC